MNLGEAAPCTGRISLSGVATTMREGDTTRSCAGPPSKRTLTPSSSVGRFWLGFRPRSMEATDGNPEPLSEYKPPSVTALGSPLNALEI